ncbi:MAG: hypothetical protein IH991_25185 [Planctomycetes bacterium]|nr:hypothetical protein [Planctomycetota bacterium]
MSGGKQLRQWTISKELKEKWLDHNKQSHVALTADGTTVAFNRPDHTVSICDTETGKHLRLLAGHDEAIRSLAFFA